MSSIDEIIERARNGHKVRFYQGYYGNQWVEVKGGWLLPSKTRYDLTAEQIAELKKGLRAIKLQRAPDEGSRAA